MIKFSILIVACALGSLVQQDQVPNAATPLTQSLTQKSPESSPAHNIDQQKIDMEVADVMELRQQSGGGVTEILGDFSLEMPGKKQGEDAEEPYPSPQEQFMAALMSFAKAHQEETQATAKQRTFLRERSNVFEVVEPTQRQETVWDAARQLEEVAALLEQVREYERADQLRQSAAELWKSSRR